MSEKVTTLEDLGEQIANLHSYVERRLSELEARIGALEERLTEWASAPISKGVEPKGPPTDVVELDATGRPRREAKGPSWFDQFMAGLRGQ